MRFGWTLVLASVVVVLSACTETVNENTSVAAAAASTLSISVSSGALEPAFSPDVHTYDLSSFTTLQDVTITVQGRTGHVLGTTTTDSVPSTLPKLAIAAGATFAVGVDAGPNG